MIITSKEKAMKDQETCKRQREYLNAEAKVGSRGRVIRRNLKPKAFLSVSRSDSSFPYTRVSSAIARHEHSFPMKKTERFFSI